MQIILSGEYIAIKETGLAAVDKQHRWLSEARLSPHMILYSMDVPVAAEGATYRINCIGSKSIHIGICSGIKCVNKCTAAFSQQNLEPASNTADISHVYHCESFLVSRGKTCQPHRKKDSMITT